MEDKFLNFQGVSDLWQIITTYINNKIWVGKKIEYDVAAALGEIPEGTLVIITDESDVIIPPNESSSAIAILGIAQLGEMILGKR